MKVAGHYVYEVVTALKMLVPIPWLHPLKGYPEDLSSSHSSCSCISAFYRVKLIHICEKIIYLWTASLVLCHRLSSLCNKSSLLFIKVEAYLWFYERNTEIKVSPTWSRSKIKYCLISLINLRLFLQVSRNYSFIFLVYMHKSKHEGCSLIKTRNVLAYITSEAVMAILTEQVMVSF